MYVICITAKWTMIFILRPITFQTDKCLFALFALPRVSFLCTLSSLWWLTVHFQREWIGVLKQHIGQQLILRKRSARFSKMKWNIGLSNVGFFFQVLSSSVYLHGPSRLYGYNLKTFYSNFKPCCILFRFAKPNRNNAL